VNSGSDVAQPNFVNSGSDVAQPNFVNSGSDVAQPNFVNSAFVNSVHVSHPQHPSLSRFAPFAFRLPGRGVF